MITYTYDYHHLTGINYPDHPENNVKYYYGGRNASQNRIGRLMLREDGTGAIEYFYGKMGEVTKTRRTMIVPNQAIATYVTQWTYDSHNRLLEMIILMRRRLLTLTISVVSLRMFMATNHSKIFYLLNISELNILKNATANNLETSYILFLSQPCNIQRTL